MIDVFMPPTAYVFETLRKECIYLIDSLGNILLSDVRDVTEEFIIPSDEDYNQVLEGKPVFITGNLNNKTTL